MTDGRASPNRLLAAALAYAERGWPVFPVHSPRPGGGCSCGKPGCQHPGKHPGTEHGLREASTNPETILDW